MKESKFQFTNPFITNLYFSVNENFDPNYFQQIQVSSHETAKRTEQEASVELKVTVGAQDSTSPFFVSITMSANFKWDTTLADEMVDNLLKCNAPALILSYIRPHIAMLTNSTQYPAYNIPFMNFTESESTDANDAT
jgi:Preprotein translocase subunit SecB